MNVKPVDEFLERMYQLINVYGQITKKFSPFLMKQEKIKERVASNSHMKKV